jgi:steroid 5-alpha reductase family enzyme
MRRWSSYSQEDFRYQNLRTRVGPWFPLIDLFGIELYPTLLVFLGCLPLIVVSGSEAPLGGLDGLAAAVTLTAILLETVADEQMWAYRKIRTDEAPICRQGLWSRTQHPNYLGEILFWWGIWLFGLAADASAYWTITGAIAMTFLFVFISIPLMLTRKRERYENYDQLTKDIPVLLPRLF